MSLETRGLARARQVLVSFDGGYRCCQEVMIPDRYRHLQNIPEDEPRIVKGGGYSYSAAGFGGGGVVQDVRCFNRVLALDLDECVIEVEAGITLGRLFRVATNHGLYLPIQPGYPEITVGGCIAADIHGKNPMQDGTFRRVVLGLSIFHPSLGIVEASPDKNRELFDLTCGGYGLTGHILSARIQLTRLPSNYMILSKKIISCFRETLELLDELSFQNSIGYTWQTFTCNKRGFGHGYLYNGMFGTDDMDESFCGDASLTYINAKTRGSFHFSIFNRCTVFPFNIAYDYVQKLEKKTEKIDLWQALFPVSRKAMYFKLFGHKGFHEYQVLFPRQSFLSVEKELKQFFTNRYFPITLVSCKLFQGIQSNLRFDGNGISLAIDFPRGPWSKEIISFLDSLTVDMGGIPNIIKDSRLPREMALKCFPNLDKFGESILRVDSRRIYRSELSERLQI